MKQIQIHATSLIPTKPELNRGTFLHQWDVCIKIISTLGR